MRNIAFKSMDTVHVGHLHDHMHVGFLLNVMKSQKNDQNST